MNSDDYKTQRIGFSISESLLIEFKEFVEDEKTTVPKLISQFMLNYTDHLDPSYLIQSDSFLKRKKVNKIHFTMAIPAGVSDRFREKTIAEGVKMTTVIEHFMMNYIEFMRKRKAKR